MLWLSPISLLLDQIERGAEFVCLAKQDNQQFISASRAIHCALSAVMVGALSGPDETGAYRERTRVRWLTYLRQEIDVPPDADDVLSFDALLVKIQSKDGLAVYGAEHPIQLSAEEQTGLNRLNRIRDWIEHPRPSFHGIDTPWILSAIQSGAIVCLRLAEHRSLITKIDESEIERVRVAVSKIVQCCNHASGVACQ